MSAGLDVGAVDAPGGDFTAWTAGLQLGMTEQALRPRSHAVRPLRRDERAAWTGWRVRGGAQAYTDIARREGSTTPEDVRIDLFALKFDYLIGRNAYLTGQAAGAHDGEAGGYASGLVGGGLETAAWNRVRLGTELTAGAAGGGGVDVGNGFIVQGLVGVTVDLTPALGVQLMGGRLVAPNGEMDTPVHEAGLVYRFSTPRVVGR